MTAFGGQVEIFCLIRALPVLDPKPKSPLLHCLRGADQNRPRFGAGTPWSLSRWASSHAKRFIADFFNEADSFKWYARNSACLIQSFSWGKLTFAASASVCGVRARLPISFDASR
jgi:hypothetical protein